MFLSEYGIFSLPWFIHFDSIIFTIDNFCTQHFDISSCLLPALADPKFMLADWTQA